MIHALILMTLGQVPSDYNAMREAAIATGKPLVVGVGCAAPRGEWFRCHVGAPFHDWRFPVVIVAVPDGDRLIWKADLEPGAMPSQVRQILSPRPAASVGSPAWFQERRPRAASFQQC